MKIKSLLLGSAAAMMAVSTAQAADIIIPEPEVVEYVRVCDVAGEGFFVIPGTETCLRISGYVQYEINFDGNDENVVPTVGNDVVPPFVNSVDILDEGDAFDKAWEARIQLDGYRDTELGILRTVIRMTAGGDVDWQDNVNRLDRVLGQTDADVNDIDLIGARALEVDRAYFDLAGLRMGLDVSAWDAIGFGGPADVYNVGGPVTGVVRYTANFGPSFFVLSLEEDTTQADFLPAAVSSFGYDAAGIVANLAVAVQHFDVIPAGQDRTVWGVKGNASYDFGPATIGAGLQYSGNGYGDMTMYNTNYEWVLGADVAFDATEDLTLGLGFQYAINEAITPIALGADDDWSIGALVDYDITETLNTNLRVRYNDDDEWSARLRFRSSF